MNEKNNNFENVIKKVFTEAFISLILEFVKSPELLVKLFIWYAFIASYVASFSFESYSACKFNVCTLVCVYDDNTMEIGKISTINIIAKLCNFIFFLFSI